MGAGTEIVFVEGHSRDDTYAAIEAAIARHPERRMRLLRQRGKGKGDAVRLGFAEAKGGVLMILDADLTVAPEDLPRFYRALRSGRGEFINGVRFVYPMEKQAMRFLNLLGNKFFSLGFSWLLGQNVKDTLCGTKVLSRADYDTIAANRAYFGDFDPFGDFDLIFGAAKLDLKIVDMPVRYHERTYGQNQYPALVGTGCYCCGCSLSRSAAEIRMRYIARPGCFGPAAAFVIDLIGWWIYACLKPDRPGRCR